MTALELVDEQIAAALRNIGITHPDSEYPLHRRLVDALVRTRNESWGDQLVAMRWEFGWEHEHAGTEFATAKTDYEKHVAAEKFRLTNSEGMSVAKAVIAVDASDEANEMKLAFRLAEQRERSMRNFLYTIQAALDNWRTGQANTRAGDAYHGRSGT